MTSLRQSLPRQLETQRLTLEFWNQSDEHYAAVLGAFNNPTADPSGDSEIKTRSNVDELIKSISFQGEEVCPGRVADTALVCLPRLKSTGELIGCIINCQEPHYKDVPTAGWLIQESFMGQGLAPEAAKEMLRFATEDLGIRRIMATPNKSNPRSHRVAQKAGLVTGPEFTNSKGEERVMFHLPGMEVTDELMAMVVAS